MNPSMRICQQCPLYYEEVYDPLKRCHEAGVFLEHANTPRVVAIYCRIPGWSIFLNHDEDASPYFEDLKLPANCPYTLEHTLEEQE